MNRRTFCAILPAAAGALRLAQAAPATQSARQRLPFDQDWRFLLGDPSGAEAASFDASAWRAVELPHDWSIEGKIAADNPMSGGGGYFPSGIGWYRRSFTAPPAWDNRRVLVEFEGVYMNATVYINGEQLGMHPYGYTTFHHDLTPHLKRGAANLLAVRVDQSQQMNSRWYSGSGIYRHVWLHVTDAVHVAPWGVSVATPEASAAHAKVAVKTKVANESAAPASVTLHTALYSASGAAVGQSSAMATVKAGDNAEFAQEIPVERPALWGPASPTLYRAVTRVMSGAKLLDEVTTPFGIRSIEWSAEKGFLLNGESIKMNGGCAHHDNGPLGAAAFDRAEERRVQIMKQAGFTAIRTSHNPPSPAFLDACDRLGMLVMDEAFDCWSRGKNKFDYNVVFKDWWQRDIDAMVLRDRNHPSVVMWSIGNEIPERGEPLGAQEAKTIADYLRTLDRTRPIASALNSTGNWPNTDGFYSALDVGGYNYNLSNHAADRKRVPTRIMACTESFPRATFDDWSMVTDFPYIVGSFVWTAIDYLGESGLGRATLRDVSNTAREGYGAPFPYHGADCGDIDICGFSKAIAHYRNIIWDRGEKLYLGVRQPVPEGKTMSVTQWGVWPVYTSWTWPGMEGKPLDVEIYSRGDSVRLYLGDTLIGEKPTTRKEQFKANFSVPYAPGTLTAVALRDGKQIAESWLHTAGDAAQLRLTADRSAIRSDGQDLSFVTVEALDAAGKSHPNADQQVTFALSGPGAIAGVGSGDMTSPDPYQGTGRKLFHGKALVVVRASHKAGAIILTAKAPGLKDATIHLQSHA
jgi:beta-galactosidase